MNLPKGGMPYRFGREMAQGEMPSARQFYKVRFKNMFDVWAVTRHPSLLKAIFAVIVVGVSLAVVGVVAGVFYAVSAVAAAIGFVLGLLAALLGWVSMRLGRFFWTVSKALWYGNKLEKGQKHGPQ